MFEHARTVEFKRSDCVPSEIHHNKPLYQVPREGDTEKSPVYKTIEEKTDEYMTRKRDQNEKHSSLLTQEMPIQARLQKWEVALRKKDIPISSISSKKKKQITMHKFTINNTFGHDQNSVSKAPSAKDPKYNVRKTNEWNDRH